MPKRFSLITAACVLVLTGCPKKSTDSSPISDAAIASAQSAQASPSGAESAMKPDTMVAPRPASLTKTKIVPKCGAATLLLVSDHADGTSPRCGILCNTASDCGAGGDCKVAFALGEDGNPLSGAIAKEFVCVAGKGKAADAGAASVR